MAGTGAFESVEVGLFGEKETGDEADEEDDEDVPRVTFILLVKLFTFESKVKCFAFNFLGPLSCCTA